MCGFPLGSPVSFHIPAACKGPMARDTLCRLANIRQPALILYTEYTETSTMRDFILFFSGDMQLQWSQISEWCIIIKCYEHLGNEFSKQYQGRILQIWNLSGSNITFNVRLSPPTGQYSKITGQDWLFSILTFLAVPADNAFRHWVKTDVSSHYIDIHNRPLLL